MADNNPSSWLGLLKWSLSYTDGTKPSDETLGPMSEEDRKFLEAVMKDGIVDESKRMRDILTSLTDEFQRRMDNAQKKEEGKAVEESKEELSTEEMEDLLMELREIVEQIDFAQYFVGMGGLPFLLGCATERQHIPVSVRSACLVLLATLAQNNPPVQDALLGQNAVNTLVDLYCTESVANHGENEGEESNDTNGQLRGRIVQALSCIVRSHVDAEESFCQNGHCRAIIESGLGAAVNLSSEQSEARDALASSSSSPPPNTIKKRCLFLLRALVCSDTSSRERVRAFQTSIEKVIDFIDASVENDADIRETSLQLLLQILEQKKSVNMILEKKNAIVSTGVARVAAIRALPEGEDKEFAQVEIELWENLIVELARGQRDSEASGDVGSTSSAAPLLLTGRPANDPCDTLPQ